MTKPENKIQSEELEKVYNTIIFLKDHFIWFGFIIVICLLCFGIGFYVGYNNGNIETNKLYLERYGDIIYAFEDTYAIDGQVNWKFENISEIKTK